MGAGRIGVHDMADGRYWVTYVSEREHATGCDSVRIERVADTSNAAATLATEFMRNAWDVMENDSSVTKCIVHIYDCEMGCFPIHRTLEHVRPCDVLHWFSLDE